MRATAGASDDAQEQAAGKRGGACCKAGGDSADSSRAAACCGQDGSAGGEGVAGDGVRDGATACARGERIDALLKTGRTLDRRHGAGVIAVIALVVAAVACSSWADKFDIAKAFADLPGGIVWLIANFTPSERSLAGLSRILPALLETVLDAVSAGAVAAVVSYVLAALSARRVGIAGRTVAGVVRVLASIMRNIPMVAWAFILLFAFKQGEFTGWLALFFKSFGFLTRAFLESIDDLSEGPFEAVRACGASRFQMALRVMWPESATQVVSWTLYQIDANIRDATLVGMLTGTGIGFVFNYFYRSFRYDEAGLVILFVAVAVLVCEAVSNWVRRRIIGQANAPRAKRRVKKQAAGADAKASAADADALVEASGASVAAGATCACVASTAVAAGRVAGEAVRDARGGAADADANAAAGAPGSVPPRSRRRAASRSTLLIGAVAAVVAALSVWAFAQMGFGTSDLGRATHDALRNLGVMALHPEFGHYAPADLFASFGITVGLSVLATFWGSLIALIIAVFAASNLSNRIVSNVIKAVMAVVRAVPTILWVMVFTVAIGLGAEAAVVGMACHSVAFLVKAYSEAFEETNPQVIEALRSSGASFFQVVMRGVIPDTLPEVLSWTFMRFESNFRNAVTVGAIAGSGGIGYQLYLSGQYYFSMREVGLIVYLCLAASLVLELAATAIRKRSRTASDQVERQRKGAHRGMRAQKR
ncbi:MAG: ABC transporter permease subunit [Eggerthellaceae bacterium]|jgi:phosphonate transport system permease protein